MSLDKFYRGSSILWAVALLYLILNPVIVFGKDYLHNQLILKSKLFSPWSYKTIKKTETKDLILLKKVNKSIPELIYKLKLLEQDFNFLMQKKNNAKSLSKKLKIPNTHLKFFFKYHCKLSFHEYLNLLKVALAIELIGQGFLNDRTVDSLSNTCHFESRNTFYKNFKKFTGSSPSRFS
jgi:AraC-like DNA-binding protein